MNLEPTILVVSARDPDERIMAELERQGLFVERSRLDAFADTFPLVAPDLVVCLGAHVAPVVLREMLVCELALPAALAVICLRGQDEAIRALHPKLIDTVLPGDLPMMTLGSQVASAARRIHGRALTAIRSRSPPAAHSQPLAVGAPPGDSEPSRRPAAGRLNTLADSSSGAARLGSRPRRTPEPLVSAPSALGRFRQRSPDRSRWLRGGKARRAVVGDLNLKRAEAIAAALSERGLDVLIVPLDPYRTQWARLQAHEPEVVLVDLPSIEGPAQVWFQLFQADRQLGKVRVVKLNFERVYDEFDEQVSLAALEPHIEELSSYRSEMPTIVAEEELASFDSEDEEQPTIVRDESHFFVPAQTFDAIDESPTALRIDLSELNSPPGARSFSAESTVGSQAVGPETSPFPGGRLTGSSRPPAPASPPSVQLADAVALESRPVAAPQPSPFPAPRLEPDGPRPWGDSAPPPPVAVAFPAIPRPGLRTPVPHPKPAPHSPSGVPNPFPPTQVAPVSAPQPVAASASESSESDAGQPVPAPPQSVPTSPLWAAPAPPETQRRRPAPTTASRAATSSGMGMSSSPPPELESRTGLPAVAKFLIALVPALALGLLGVGRYAPDWLPASLRKPFSASPDESLAVATPAEAPEAAPAAPAGHTPPTKRKLNPWVVPVGKPPTCAQVADPPNEVTGATIERGSMAWDHARRLLMLGDMDAAHKHMCQSVMDNPQSLALEGLASYYLLKHSPDEAARWAKRALAVRQDSRKGGELLGDSFSQLGKEEEARAAWIEALKLEPEDRKTAALVSVSYVEEAEKALAARDLRRAESMARRAAGLDPESAAASAVLGSALLAQGFSEHAELWAKRCGEQQPGEPLCLVLTARLLESAGKLDEAEALFLRVTETAPGNKPAWQGLTRLRAR